SRRTGRRRRPAESSTTRASTREPGRLRACRLLVDDQDLVPGPLEPVRDESDGDTTATVTGSSAVRRRRGIGSATRGAEMVPEARLERRDEGMTPVTDGWFTVNVRDAAWVRNDAFGAACIFEGDDAPFADVGFTLAVVQPGKPSGMYHRE